jgi:hypothetical protein
MLPRTIADFQQLHGCRVHDFASAAIQARKAVGGLLTCHPGERGIFGPRNEPEMNRRLMTLAVCLMALTWGEAGRAQVGFDRPGGDYNSALVRSGDPAACAARCDRDNRCRAWSFSYPRTVARDAMCRLKYRVTPVKEDSCCVSGVRGAGLLLPKGPQEFAIDRTGGDYRSFDIVPDATGASCAKACQADAKCRAFTYVRQGYGGASARCYLKDRITRPRRKPCCISGVVR